MTAAIVWGAGLGLGLVLVLRGLHPCRPSLVAAMAHLDGRAASARGTWVRVTRPPWVRSAAVASDLRVTGRPAERLAVEKVAAALTGLGAPPLFGLLLFTNGVDAPLGAVAVASVFLAVGGFLLPDRLLRDAARTRRRAFTAALSSYLDLVDIVLAGGAGIETALEVAADAGGGWAFAELRGALTRSRALRRSPWDCFGDLGAELGIAELRELAASVRLAGQQGARIRASLAAKAASLRGHQLARIEADAQSATERMALPTVLMFTGFLLFIGYPAVAEILGSASW